MSASLTANLEALAPLFGVTRVAELTHLDRLGVPVFAAIRDHVVGESITVCTGKGETTERAKVSALAEAFERFSAEPRGRLAVERAPESALSRDHHLALADLIVADGTMLSAGEPIEWCLGHTVSGAVPTWVPVNAVLFPYSPSSGRLAFAPHTNGLAAAPTIREAIEHALLECIERDAYSLAIARVASGHGDLIPTIDHHLLPSRPRQYVERFKEAGLSVQLRDITSDIGVPTVLCTIVERNPEPWAHLGCAARYTGEAAALAAIFEAAQSRLTDIQGAREDLPARDDATVDTWFIESEATKKVTVPNSLPSSAGLNGLVECLHARGLATPVFVDLSDERIPLSAVRVVAPGLEFWAKDPERAGARVRRWIDKV